VEISKKFAKILSDELNVSVYLYGESQPLEYRRELSQIRNGEYEGLEARIGQTEWRPDFGPTEFNASYGASCVGARQFLIAFNINVLGTKEQAHRIGLIIQIIFFIN
jgi:glutamate formiminotransferase/formiminotetrahydrofolate cyclodeaminase